MERASQFAGLLDHLCGKPAPPLPHRPLAEVLDEAFARIWEGGPAEARLQAQQSLAWGEWFDDLADRFEEANGRPWWKGLPGWDPAIELPEDADAED